MKKLISVSTRTPQNTPTHRPLSRRALKRIDPALHERAKEEWKSYLDQVPHGNSAHFLLCFTFILQVDAAEEDPVAFFYAQPEEDRTRGVHSPAPRSPLQCRSPYLERVRQFLSPHSAKRLLALAASHEKQPCVELDVNCIENDAAGGGYGQKDPL